MYFKPNEATAADHNVKVDDEVWAALRSFVDANPNDVLRNALLETTAKPEPVVVLRRDRRPGPLMTR
jgi:hypothetical protein